MNLWRNERRERTIWWFVIVKNKLTASVLLLAMTFVITLSRSSYIVKVVCGSTRSASTAILTMLWRNSWSITGQAHEKTDVNLLHWTHFVHQKMIPLQTHYKQKVVLLLFASPLSKRNVLWLITWRMYQVLTWKLPERRGTIWVQ